MQPAEAGTDSSIGLIDRTIAGGFRFMRFPRSLERRFEADTGPARSRELIVRSLLGLALFNVFLLSDWALMPDTFGSAMLMRLGIVTPLALMLLVITALNPPPVFREGVQAAIVVMASMIPPVLILTSESPWREAGHHGILLVVMFATMIQRIRFWYVLVAVIAIEGIYIATLANLPGIAAPPALSYNMVFAGGVIFSLVASYNLEHEQRLAYLLGLRDRITNSELETISRSDPLTGLGNRRSLDEAFEALRGEPEVAVLLLDIDHFKIYNDSQGHQAGDACLKQIADIISAELHDGTDAAFRFGGEEFLVLMRRENLANALLVAERIRAAIEKARIPHPAIPMGVVTASLGAASSFGNPQTEPEDLVAAADAALYAAKRDGRNRVWPRLRQGDRPRRSLQPRYSARSASGA